MAIKKTTLHPQGDQNTDLYPKTSIDQVEGYVDYQYVGDEYITVLKNDSEVNISLNYNILSQYFDSIYIKNGSSPRFDKVIIGNAPYYFELNIDNMPYILSRYYNYNVQFSVVAGGSTFLINVSFVASDKNIDGIANDTSKILRLLWNKYGSFTFPAVSNKVLPSSVYRSMTYLRMNNSNELVFTYNDVGDTVIINNATQCSITYNSL